MTDSAKPPDPSPFIESARRAMTPEIRALDVMENGVSMRLKVTREGVGPLITGHGSFHHFAFRVDDKWGKYSVLVKADLSEDFLPKFKNGSKLLFRIDSGCETGQLFGDKTCECKEQLDLALKKINEASEGMLVSIPRQDGRGLGLPFKLATLKLQRELSVDTVQASAMLDPDGERDTRTYAGVVAILLFLGIPKTTQLVLASNNPKKRTALMENGWAEPQLEEVVIPATDLTRQHLNAKRREFGHILPDSE